MKFYMVQFVRTNSQAISKEAFATEQLHFQDLMAQDLLQQVNINESKTHFWLTFKVKNEQDITEIIQTLPICSTLKQEIHPLIWD